MEFGYIIFSLSSVYNKLLINDQVNFLWVRLRPDSCLYLFRGWPYIVGLSVHNSSEVTDKALFIVNSFPKGLVFNYIYEYNCKCKVCAGVVYNKSC